MVGLGSYDVAMVITLFTIFTFRVLSPIKQQETPGDDIGPPSGFQRKGDSEKHCLCRITQTKLRWDCLYTVKTSDGRIINVKFCDYAQEEINNN